MVFEVKVKQTDFVIILKFHLNKKLINGFSEYKYGFNPLDVFKL